MKILIALLLFILYFLTVCICFSGCSDNKLRDNKLRDYTVSAKVLSINENILEGQLIGALLSSPSGHITNDMIKVGIAAEVGGGFTTSRFGTISRRTYVL